MESYNDVLPGEEVPEETEGDGNVISHYKGPPCPFYGFVGFPDSFLKGGCVSSCALSIEHGSCKMCKSDKSPDWDNCLEFNNTVYSTRTAELMESVTVTPGAPWPADKKMGLKEWFVYVMGREYVPII